MLNVTMTFSGKECPSYLIRTGRWEEFVEMVRKEYLIQKYLAGATIEYQLSTDTYQTTDEVLNNLFIEGGMVFGTINQYQLKLKLIL